MFYGESMFARRTDASKIALAALVAFCRANHIDLIDCQQSTAHLASFGAREIARREFEDLLSLRRGAAGPKAWTYDRALWAQLAIDSRGPMCAD
jgi:leucyl/phenylalanyl-tRNA--protein transferase